MAREDDPDPPPAIKRVRRRLPAGAPGVRPVRLADVAVRAGVSTATVSRAFNEPDKVSPTIRADVMRAAAALGWVPNAAARALASNRSHIAGVIVPNLGHEIFANQIEAMQERFAEAGVTLFIGCTQYDGGAAVRHVRAMLTRGVEALAIVGEEQPRALFEAIAARRIPYVVTYGFRVGSPHPCIGFDNGRAFAEVVDRLADLGHRDFGLIMQTTAGNDRAIARRDAMLRRLEARGLALRPQHVREGAWSVGFGRTSLRAILEAPGPRPTAVVCGNDPLAFGALAEARAMGVAVPAELSITGFDDIEMARHTDPPLTTVRAPDREIGRRAAEALLARLAEPESPPAAVELMPYFVERASTGPPRVALTD